MLGKHRISSGRVFFFVVSFVCFSLKLREVQYAILFSAAYISPCMLCHCREFTNMIGISKMLSYNRQGYLHCSEEIETSYSLKCKLTLNLEAASQKIELNYHDSDEIVLYLCTQCVSFPGKLTSVSHY